MNTLDIFEVMPIEFKKKRKVVHMYKKIKTKDLTASRIRDFYINLAFKDAPVVSSLKKFFLITYYPKPPILISKEDGRLYSFPSSHDLEEIQHQASLVIRVFNEFGLVEEHSSKSIWRRK